MAAKKKTAPEPVLTEAQEAQVRLFIAFESAQGLEGASVTQAQREALQEVAAFVSALAVGGGSEADWGRLVRMHATLRTLQDPKRLLVLQHVRAALASNDAESRAGNLWFALEEWVDPLFRSLDRQAIESELASRGKRRPHAIAARLSIA
ncbi:MAG TPA: hypothetical protein VHW01_05970, partial [Polyangiaceae bacterium]|nr:hypothetical protein [Polyangiaceae bacterium]